MDNNRLLSKLVTRRIYLNCQYHRNQDVLAHYIDALRMTYIDLGVKGQMDDLQNFINRATNFYLAIESGEPRFFHQDNLIGWDSFEFKRYVEHCLEIHPPKNLDFSPLHFKQWQDKL